MNFRRVKEAPSRPEPSKRSTLSTAHAIYIQEPWAAEALTGGRVYPSKLGTFALWVLLLAVGSAVVFCVTTAWG